MTIRKIILSTVTLLAMVQAAAAQTETATAAQTETISVPQLDAEAKARVEAYAAKTVAEQVETRRQIWSRYQGDEAKTKVREAWAARHDKAGHDFAKCMIDVGAFRDPRTENECWALSQVTTWILEHVSWRDQPQP